MKKLALAMIVLFLAAWAEAGTKVTFDENGVMEVDGKKTFVISFSIPPPPGGKTPDGKDAFAELAEAGTTFMRVRPTTGPQDYTESGIRTIKAWLDEAANHGMHCWVTLGHLPAID